MWSYSKAILSTPLTTAQPAAPAACSCAAALGTTHAHNRETTLLPGSSYLDPRGHSRERSQQITVCNTLRRRD